MNFKIEICTDNVESAMDAQDAGADRIELCDNLFEGGTTPSYGTIISARNNLNIGLNVLIRPRGGDFLYSHSEYEIMRRDIDFCGEYEIDGIVIGMLRPDGSIDVERTSQLVEMAHPMSVTFHRAFDMCADPFRGLEDIILSGADMLLTSGQKNSAEEGAGLISRMVKQAADRITIMPGSGISETNIAMIAGITGSNEFHLSARKVIKSEMRFRRQGILMGNTAGYDEFSRKVVDPDRIKNIISILKLI